MGYAFGVGREAPNFALDALDDGKITLAQYRGDWFPVLVFISGHDDEVVSDLSPLSAIADTLWGLRGQIIGIWVTNRAAAEPSPAAAVLSFPLVLDDGTVAAAYGARRSSGDVVPAAFVIDRTGKIVWSAEGRSALDPEALISALRDVAR